MDVIENYTEMFAILEKAYSTSTEHSFFDKDLVRLFLKFQKDSSCQLLEDAVRCGNIKLAKLLSMYKPYCKMGNDSPPYVIDEKCSCSRSIGSIEYAFIVACQMGNNDMVSMFINNRQWIWGETYTQFEQILSTCLVLAIEKNHFDVVENFMSTGSIFSKHDPRIRTPFLLACQIGRNKMVEAFLKKRKYIPCFVDEATRETGMTMLSYYSK